MGKSNKAILHGVKSTSGSSSIDLLQRNAVDLIYFGSTPFCIAAVLGLPVKLLGVSHQLKKSHGVVLRSSWKQGTPINLGTTFGSTGHQIGYSWAQNQKNIRFFFAEPQFQIEAFRVGRIDAIASWEPFLTMAEHAGGKRVATAESLEIDIFNVIAANTLKYERKYTSVKAFLRANFESTKIITEGHVNEYLNSIRFIFDDEISEDSYEDFLINGYLWHTEVATEADVFRYKASLENTERFLSNANILSNNAAPIDWSKFIETRSIFDSKQADRNLTVGYSDSTMCAAFHLAHVSGKLNAVGFRPNRRSEYLKESVALVDKKFNSSARSLYRLLERQPETAIIEARRNLESLMRRSFKSFFGYDGPNSLEYLIVELHRTNCIDMSIYSASHAIRTNGNAAAHGAISNKDELFVMAEESLKNALLVWHWWTDKVDRYIQENKVCINSSRKKNPCRAVLSRKQKFCTVCGSPSEISCQECGTKLEIEQKYCSACGCPTF